jgi:DNA-binding winged helix-turn-helix (wHTH) protein
MSFSPNDLYRFDEFELSRSRRTLLRDGQAVTLLPKTFDVLACLVENPGRVVEKEEILKAVWRESFVEENNLTQHISLLRKALTDRARYIATIPGHGYQFTAQVAAEPQPANGWAHAHANGSARHLGARYLESESPEQPLAGPEPRGASPSAAGSDPDAKPARKPEARISSFFTHLLRRIAP